MQPPKSVGNMQSKKGKATKKVSAQLAMRGAQSAQAISTFKS